MKSKRKSEKPAKIPRKTPKPPAKLFASKPEKAAPKLGPEWFTLSEMSAIFAMTIRGFHAVIRPIIPDCDIVGAGQRGAVKIRARGAIDAYAQKQVADAIAGTDKETDPLMLGPNSEALERFRLARAEMAELDLGERKQSLVQIDTLRPAFGQYASAIRRAGESLQREFGADAAKILNEALDEAEASLLKSISPADASRV